MRAAGVDPRLHARLEVRQGPPEVGGHGQFGHGLFVLDALHIVDDEAEARAKVDQRSGDAAPGLAGEHQTGRVFTVAHGQGQAADGHAALGHGGADLQHVRLQNALLAGHEVVGVVLQHGGALGVLDAGGHQLHHAHHAGGLPVALGAEAVALLLQTLDGQPRKLFERAQIAKVGDDGVVVLFHHEALKAQLDLRLHGHVAAELLPVAAVQEDVVHVVVLVHQRVGVRLADGGHVFGDLVDGVGVHGPAQLDLRLDLVALGDGHVAHVVRHAQYAHVAALHQTHGRAHPVRHALLHALVAPMAGDHLALDAHAGDDVAVFAVAMGGLVLVHEVHVDGVVGDLLVELRVQVQKRLAVLAQARDPALGRGEGVHPGDDAGALRVGVGFVEGLADERVGDQRRLPDKLIGQRARGVELFDDDLRMLGHVGEALVAVEVLRAGEEPELVRFLQHGYHPPVSRL